MCQSRHATSVWVTHFFRACSTTAGPAVCVTVVHLIWHTFHLSESTATMPSASQDSCRPFLITMHNSNTYVQVEEDLKQQLAKQSQDLAASGAQQQKRKAELQALGAELEQANAEQINLQQELKDLGAAAQVRIWSLSVLHCRCLCA